MKKTLFLNRLFRLMLLTLIFNVCSASLRAEVTTGSFSDDLEWSYDSETQTFTLSGSGVVEPELMGSTGLTASIVKLESTGSGEIAIGVYAFSECSSLTTVSLPNATSIGEEAFSGCENLESIELGIETVPASYFFNFSNLKSVTLPNATSIGDEAFFECSSLTTVTLPNATSIGVSAFFECGNLESIELGIESVPDSYFSNFSNLKSVTLPNATEIEDYAFQGLGNLTTVSLPNATEIGEEAFGGCSDLTTVSLPKATTIGAGAFIECVNLTTVSLPNAMTIGEEAFGGCENLNSIELGIESVPDSYFSNFSNLTTVSLPKATTIGNEAFYMCSKLTTASLPKATMIGDYAFMSCSNLTSASLPNATTIGSNAFYGCGNLTTVSLPNATEIGVEAFFECGKLTSVSLPKATTIGESAFGECSDLTTVSLPKATTIGAGAFIKCGNLTSVSLPNATEIGEWAFAGCSNLTTVSLPKATTIGDYAFFECGNLTTLTLPISATMADYSYSGCQNINTLILVSSETNNLENFSSEIFWNKDDHLQVLALDMDAGHPYSLSVTPMPMAHKDTVAATCSATGTEGGWYNDNLDIFVADNYVVKSTSDNVIAAGHDFSEKQLTAEPDEAGLYSYVCKNDPSHLSDDKVIVNYNGSSNLELKYDDSEDAEQPFYTDELTLTDGEIFYSPVPFVAKKLEYSRIANKDTMSIIFPCDVPADMVNGKVYELVDFDGEVLNYRKANDGLVGNTPYLIYKNRGENRSDKLISTLTDVVVYATSELMEIPEDASSKAVNFGSYNKDVYTSDAETVYYAYKNGKFWRVNNQLTMAPFRSAIRYDRSESASISNGNYAPKTSPSSLSINFTEDDACGDMLKESTEVFEGKVNVYDVLGRAVRLNVEAAQCLDGLKDDFYIVNGKKVRVINGIK